METLWGQLPGDTRHCSGSPGPLHTQRHRVLPEAFGKRLKVVSSTFQKDMK